MTEHRLANVEPEREQTRAEPAEQPNDPPWEDSMDEESETEIIREEWSQGYFVQVWKDGDTMLANIPDREAERIAEKADATPNDALEGLADKWADAWDPAANACARDLREVIEQYE